MLTQSEVMRAAIDAGAVEEGGETSNTRIETMLFDNGNVIGVLVGRNGINFAMTLPRTGTVDEVKQWVSETVLI
ncbi:hypothetical protein [Mesorhizobium sp.]|uniref:hypothetical protein n=1 Tax=Mesorhizobium sp. TaxID=1871066 RepID=UPI00257C7267|nr:hypothetical protein [Mesorhizobium sp.]